MHQKQCTSVAIARVSYDKVDQETSYRISELQQSYFTKCVNLAYKSNLTQKHGCVLVRNNKIISCGYNFKLKNTMQHTYVSNTENNVYSVHAEISTIKKVKKQDLSRCELYVIRIGPLAYKASAKNEPDTKTFEYKYSCPCDVCAQTIRSYGIKKVYYSINS